MNDIALLRWSPAAIAAAVAAAVVLPALILGLQRWMYNLYFHPLSHMPGPRLAAATKLWKAYVECIAQRSFRDELAALHERYGTYSCFHLVALADARYELNAIGSVVRVGPNELHFASPQAYHDIHNNKNRWDKEEDLYHSFGEDRSSFGFLTFKEARERRDIVGRMLSSKAVESASGLVVEKVEALCQAIEQQNRNGKSIDFFYAYRCFTMDVITYLCFGHSTEAINAPEFKAPIIEALNASTPVFVRFKHAAWYKSMIMNCPPSISRIVSPATVGLVNLQQILKAQINGLTEHPEALKHLPHNMTVYHQLLNPEAYAAKEIPPAGSLYEESQALMFGGADTTGQTLMVGTFHIIQKQPHVHQKLRAELLDAWPHLEEAPTLRILEKLPYLNAVIKEALRMNSGVISGLARVVPREGATIDGIDVPGEAVVSCGSTFVHWNPSIFPNPYEFEPQRWLDNQNLDKWLVAFSKGPRACLGMNLAWAELRYCIAHIFRKFDIKPEPSNPETMVMREAFLPFYYGPHIRARMVPVTA